MEPWNRPHAARWPLSSYCSPRFMPGLGCSRPISLHFWTIVVCGRKRSAWCWPPARRCGWAAGPAAARLADRLDAAKLVCAGCAAAAAMMALLYLPAQGFWPLFAVGLLQAAAVAPLAPLCDTLALGAAAPARRDDTGGPGFDYGWVRGAGSGAFIAGLVLSGQVVGRYGIAAVIWLNAALLAAAASCAPRVRQLPPRPTAQSTAPSPERGSVVGLFRLRQFRRVVLVAALILGSHAMHDSFAVIRWGAAGIGPRAAGLLWSESVAAEVVVFFIIGRPLLDRLGPAGAAALAAAAGMVRWAGQ